MRVFLIFEGKYDFSAHGGSELGFKDTHFGTSQSSSQFATEMNVNRSIMCSCVMNGDWVS
jgi:hypothetical protein